MRDRRWHCRRAHLFGRSSDRSSSGLIQHRPGEIRRSERGDRGAVAQAGMAPQLLHRLIIWAVAVQQQRMPHRGRLLPTQRVLVTAKKQPPVFAMVRSRVVATLHDIDDLIRGKGVKVPFGGAKEFLRMGAWSQRIASAARSRRRGDRISVDVRYWHEADVPRSHADVRLLGQSGQHLLGVSLSAFDLSSLRAPSATSPRRAAKRAALREASVPSAGFGFGKSLYDLVRCAWLRRAPHLPP